MKSIFIKLILISAFSTFSVIALAQEDQAKEKVELSPTPLIDQAVTSDIEAEESWAEDGVALSADDIARELSNPNTVLGSLNFNLDYKTFKGDLPGASEQSAFSLTFSTGLALSSQQEC